MSTVSRKTLLGLGHEARRDAVLCADALDDVLEQRSAVGHLSNLAKLESGFEDAWSGLGVPAFNITRKLGACVEDVVVVFLVVDGTGERVAEHSFSQGGELVRGVLLEVCGWGGG